MVSHQLSVVYRTETIFHVEPAVSAKNIYADITIAWNPGMADKQLHQWIVAIACTVVDQQKINILLIEYIFTQAWIKNLK